MISNVKTVSDFFQLDRFNISPASITQMVFHCAPEIIQPDVILMPWWQPEVFSQWVDRITIISDRLLFEFEYKGKKISVVRSGIGAPQAGDAVLALGFTACKRLLFAGSVGGLQPNIQIGDLMMPEFSYSGDGFCRYLETEVPKADCLIERVFPDKALSSNLLRSASLLARDAGIAIHTGPVYCIDSILSQFRLLDYFADELGCIGIEMETAAVFKAARLVGIQAAALFSVSDVPVMKKTLYAGRSPEERDRRIQIRANVLAKALLDCLD